MSPCSRMSMLTYRLVFVSIFILSGISAFAAQMDSKPATQVNVQQFDAKFSGEWIEPSNQSRKITPLSNGTYQVTEVTPGFDESMAAASFCEPRSRVLEVKCQSQDFDVEVSGIQEKMFKGQVAQGAFCGGYVTAQAKIKRQLGQFSSYESPSYGPIVVTVVCSK